jgi:hypothetical protein
MAYLCLNKYIPVKEENNMKQGAQYVRWFKEIKIEDVLPTAPYA